MYLPSSTHGIVELFFPLYYALYFAWPPFLIYLFGHRRRFLSRLITLWTGSGVISMVLVLTHLNTVSLMPPLGPEPYNTIALVSIRLAILVTLACLSVQRAEAMQQAR